MSSVSRFIKYGPDRLRRLFSALDPFPARRTLRGYNGGKLRADLRAGLNVALLGIPQGMAYAMIAGLPISYGLFGTVAACLIGALFAGSRLVVPGPTNATAALLLSAFLASGATEYDKTLLLPLLLVMAGLMQVAAAWLRVGSLIAYISRSVIVGYVSAAAVLIIANQIQNLLGFRVPESATLIGMLRELLRSAGELHWPTVVVSAATAAVYLALGRFTPRLPNIAITLLAAAGLGFAATWLGRPVTMLPAVSASSWAPGLPALDFGNINQLASAALAIAFLSILETSSIAKSLAASTGERLNLNQEIFAMGMANVGCGFLGGTAASGSPTRSSLSVASGAATPAANIACALILLVFIVALGPLIGYVPRGALAVVIVLAALPLINLRQIRFVVRSTRADAAVFVVTGGAAILFPLDAAIFIGTATSLVLFLRKAGEPELTEYAFTPEGQLAAVSERQARPLPEISIVHVEGSLFFGAAELLQEQIRRAFEDPNLRILILRLKHAHHLDASAILALEELVQFMRENGRSVIVSGARKDVVRICKRTGLLDRIGRENFFPEWPQNPTVSTRNALKRAQQLLGQREAEVRVFGEVRMKPPA